MGHNCPYINSLKQNSCCNSALMPCLLQVQSYVCTICHTEHLICFDYFVKRQLSLGLVSFCCSVHHHVICCNIVRSSVQTKGSKSHTFLTSTAEGELSIGPVQFMLHIYNNRVFIQQAQQSSPTSQSHHTPNQCHIHFS